MQDFGQISSTSLIQMLQMEMKLASSSMNVKSGFIISGYPRSMRDVVEYERKVSGKLGMRENYTTIHSTQQSINFTHVTS